MCPDCFFLLLHFYALDGTAGQQGKFRRAYVSFKFWPHWKLKRAPHHDHINGGQPVRADQKVKINTGGTLRVIGPLDWSSTLFKWKINKSSFYGIGSLCSARTQSSIAASPAITVPVGSAAEGSEASRRGRIRDSNRCFLQQFFWKITCQEHERNRSSEKQTTVIIWLGFDFFLHWDRSIANVSYHYQAAAGLSFIRPTTLQKPVLVASSRLKESNKQKPSRKKVKS